MLKNGYKIILIKEGKYDLKQFNISRIHIVSTFGLIFILTASLFFIFSDYVAVWSDKSKINEHRRNNHALLQNVKVWA